MSRQKPTSTISLYDILCPKCGQRGQLKCDIRHKSPRYSVSHYIGKVYRKGKSLGWFPHGKYVSCCYLGLIQPSYAKFGSL